MKVRHLALADRSQESVDRGQPLPAGAHKDGDELLRLRHALDQTGPADTAVLRDLGLNDLADLIDGIRRIAR
jgi:hypothetical protein